MKTIEIDIDKFKSTEDVLKALNAKKVKHPGNTSFSFIYNTEIDELKRFIVLVFVNAAFQHLNKQLEKERFKFFIADAMENILNHQFSISDFESQIESEWKTDFEWRHKQPKDKENPLDEMLGMWKGKNVSLEQIRKKAWPARN